MPITPAQREERRKHIGSSDAPSIMGVSPWATATDVWLQKMYPTEDITGSKAIEIGNVCESSLLLWAADELGVEIEVNVSRLSPEGVLAASHDAIITGKREGIEAKTSGILWAPGLDEQWGENGTGDVPDHVLVQVQHQIGVSDLDRVWVPALLGGKGLRLYCVERNERMIADCRDICLDWWNRYVIPGVRPDDTPSLDVVKRIRRTPQKPVEVAYELYGDWSAKRDARLLAEKAEKDAQATLLAALGDGDAITINGQLTATYYESQRKGYTVKPSTFRQIRVKS